ncbi:MAG: four helix bundle protein [Nitrospirae bacterium]|nr:four helix bundle protein [Nitrospirota bacterium]MBI3378154.1 four helix bundle protein [Nitrospirota bacterium]
MKSNNGIQERTYEFAIMVVKFVKKLPANTGGFVIGRQLIRSGTSIGANIEEATGAFSKDDFIFKMNIALKESRETNYWLRLIKDSELMKSTEVENLINESENIKNILSAIVRTSKERREKREVKCFS